jgi:hypothetical protein
MRDWKSAGINPDGRVLEAMRIIGASDLKIFMLYEGAQQTPGLAANAENTLIPGHLFVCTDLNCL